MHVRLDRSSLNWEFRPTWSIGYRYLNVTSSHPLFKPLCPYSISNWGWQRLYSLVPFWYFIVMIFIASGYQTHGIRLWQHKLNGEWEFKPMSLVTQLLFLLRLQRSCEWGCWALCVCNIVAELDFHFLALFELMNLFGRETQHIKYFSSWLLCNVIVPWLFCFNL